MRSIVAVIVLGTLLGGCVAPLVPVTFEESVHVHSVLPENVTFKAHIKEQRTDIPRMLVKL